MVLKTLAILLLFAASAFAQDAPATNQPGSAIPVRCVNTLGTAFESCGGSGAAGTDVNISGVGGNTVTTSIPVSGTVTFSNATIGVTHANFANLDAALSTLATQSTLAQIKAKTDNLDVLLSTRTKPADQQHAIIDSGSVTFTNASIGITGSVAVTGPLTDTQLRASAVPVSLATAPALVAGTAIIGKVGIDQTTPGTTNKVTVGSDVVHTIIDSATLGTVTVSDGAGALNVICDSGCGTAGTGQQVMSASAPVVIASDQTSVPVTATVSNGVTAGTAGTPSTDVLTVQGAPNAVAQYVALRGPALPLNPCNAVRRTLCAPKGY